jgi:plastocyanin
VLRGRITSLLLVVGILAAGCAGGTGTASPERSSTAPAPPSAADSVTVEVTGFRFVPASLDVRAGTTVRYINRDRAAHTVTHGRDGEALPDAAFDLFQEKDATVDVEFTGSGVFPVTCTFHPTMNQTVTVAP